MLHNFFPLNSEYSLNQMSFHFVNHRELNKCMNWVIQILLKKKKKKRFKAGCAILSLLLSMEMKKLISLQDSHKGELLTTAIASCLCVSLPSLSQSQKRTMNTRKYIKIKVRIWPRCPTVRTLILALLSNTSILNSILEEKKFKLL